MKNRFRNQKISVHIPLFLENNISNKLKNFKKICNSYLKLSNKTRIFVHTNKIIKNKRKNVKYIYYDFNKLKSHPFKLTWYCRNLMKIQRNNYDIFIYSEDDVLFNKQNFKYWLSYKDLCGDNNYNLGFMRFEIKNKKLYSSDQVKQSKYFVNLSNQKFIVVDNPYCAFWIYQKNEFIKFTESKYWEFNWKWVTISGILLIREMSSIGWHGINMNGIDMNRYLATIIPLKKNQIDKNSLIRHLSDKFVKAPAGLFGTFKIKNIAKKKLELFKPNTFLQRILKRTNYILYYFLRINIKKYIK